MNFEDRLGKEFKVPLKMTEIKRFKNKLEINLKRI